MKTFMAKPQEVNRKWYLIDAEGKTLGRLSTVVAGLLRGKHKPEFTPHVDCGDYIIIVNAGKINFTGKKMENKLYRYHTGHVGGLKEIPYKHLLVKRPEKAVELAVKGMLPKNSLGRAMFKKLKVFAGADHNHQAQMPEVFEV